MAVAPYSVEVWNPETGFVANLSELASNLKGNADRNDGGGYTFDLDTAQVRRLAESIDLTPGEILREGINEIRVARDGSYLRQGGQIAHVNDGQGEGEVEKRTQVQVKGYLDLLADRFIEKKKVISAPTQVATILSDIVGEMESGSSDFWATPVPTAARAGFGIVDGDLDLTIGTKTITYEPGTSVKDILVRETELIATECDVEIDYLKQLHIYKRMGENKDDVAFELGRNILSYDIPRDSTAMVNRAITYGQGTGSTNRVQSIDQDTDSQDAGYKVRQRIFQLNNQADSTTLSEHGAGQVRTAKSPIVLPKIRIDLNVDFNFNHFWIGDRVLMRIVDPDIPTQIEGAYRVEKIELERTDEGGEKVDLTVSEWE